MSIDNDSRSSEIISKYFTSKSGMDESLSDFQDKKIIHTGPKKKKASKSKTIRKDKKVKGQRDIRTLVNSRKNELLTYTKDFDQVCRSSGLDVDSEQLQIAIALSKSLQETQPQNEEVSAKPLTANERSRKIKSTLQEYGFKVPNTFVKKNKRRVASKNSKLLNTSESEKRELISTKYSEILKRNHTCPTNALGEFDHSDKEIYHKTTNILYSKIRAVDEFYVPNLIEKTTHRTYMLKNWSEIPGRPLSPVIEKKEFQFDKCSFSQQELDCLLSYPIQEVQAIIKNKSMDKYEQKLINNENRIDLNLNSETEKTNNEICSIEDNECDIKNIQTTQGDRSLSPDLFDEDDYPTTLQAKDQMQYFEIKCSAGSDKTLSMDLTECVGNMHNDQKTIMYSNKALPIELSGDVDSVETESVVSIGSIKYDIPQNITKYKTVSPNKTFLMGSQSKTLCSVTVKEIDDFMEVTDCIVSEFNPNNNNDTGIEVVSKLICLDQADDVEKYSPNNNSARVELPTDFTKSSQNTNNFENIDLTQLSEVNDKLLTSEVDVNKIKTTITLDLTQSSNSDEDLPIVKLCSNKEKSSDIILDAHDTSYNILKENIDIQENKKLLNTVSLKNEKCVDNKTENSEKEYSNIVNEKNIDVFFEGDENDDPQKINFSEVMIEKTKSNIKDDNQLLSEDDNIDLTQSPELQSMSDDKVRSNIKDDSQLLSEDKNIDLTQSPELQSISDDKIDFTQSPQSPNTTNSIESLGKHNNVSIDYDELYDDIMIKESLDIIQDQNDLKNNDKDSIVEIIDHDQSVIINMDNMLNDTEEYQVLSRVSSFIGPPQSKEEISEIKAIGHSSLHVQNSSFSTNRDNSYLPIVDVKKLKKSEDVTETSHAELSPIKISHINNKTLGTPVNDQYIIKTQNVTPMLDYESMSTPARTKELEKYGIKPFKRKRAIQLLTYIYNQTHPVVEDCAIDDMPSTSKKFKPDTHEETEPIADCNKHRSLTAIEENDADKENLYMETRVNPEIKEIECRPDDWVFQTREKAKIHSCRVPLHIAFHNYVSCRHMLRAAILRYEPVNIDIIHKDLITSGYRYNPKELLKFLDKKCITVKTTENNARNRKLNKS